MIEPITAIAVKVIVRYRGRCARDIRTAENLFYDESDLAQRLA